MTTPLVLAPFLPPSDTVSVLDIDPDCTLNRDVVRVALTALGTSSIQTPTVPPHLLTTTTDDNGDDASEPDASKAPHRVASPWTGTPLRAIVPLPRRKRASVNGTGHISARAVSAPLPCLTRSCDDADSEEENQQEDDDDARSGPRYCSYESITAAEGLSSYSFEELRVECYAQSLIARGTRPPPVTQPSLAIPPAFIPRILSRH